MKENFKRYGALILVLIAISGVCFMFSCRKSGMFIDEIYTYGLSNSHYAPFLDDCMGGSLLDKTLSRQDFMDYVTVNSGEGFDFGSVYYNQVNDVHPPLYYWIFNMVSSITPEVFSKWTGLILDYIIFMLALIMLYKLVYKLFGSRDNAVIAVALYGLSNMGLSTMLMIRMYVLLTLLTVCLAYLIACMMEKPSFKLCILTGLNIFLGLMTQYYFVFYAFFICAAYLIYALVKKEYKNAAIFSVSAFAGVGLLILVFPACLDQLFADKLVSGGNALENLAAVSQYEKRLSYFYLELAEGLKAVVYTAIALLPLIIISCGKLIKTAKRKLLRCNSLVVIIPAFITFFIVAVISPVMDSRYIYNICPVFVLVVSFLIYLLESSAGTFRHEFWVKKAAVLCAFALALWFARCLPPQYLYPEYNDYNEIADSHSESPCVYMSDNYFAPLTQDLLQLKRFEDVFVTNDPASPALDEYLAEKGGSECVVYIDISEYWSSGYVSEEMLPRLLAETDFTSFVPLYQNGLSDTYLLTK